MDPCQDIKRFFGHNAERVRNNFRATDAYGNLFVACNTEWTGDDKDYRVP